MYEKVGYYNNRQDEKNKKRGYEWHTEFFLLRMIWLHGCFVWKCEHIYNKLIWLFRTKISTYFIFYSFYTISTCITYVLVAQ